MVTATHLVADDVALCQFASPIADDDAVFWPRSIYYPDTQGVIAFMISCDRDITEDVTVEFDFAGTAEMHVDFSQLTQSPITITPGAPRAYVSVRLLRDTRFYTERELEIRIRSVTGGARMGRFNIFRTYLRSTLEAPFVAHESADSVDVAQAAAAPITITLGEDNLADPALAVIRTSDFGNRKTWSAYSRESAIVPYLLSGTAAVGVDYTISPASPLTIPAGATEAEITVTSLSPASGKTVIVTLDAENSMRRNFFSYSQIGVGMHNKPWLRDANNFPVSPWDKSFGKPSDWWMGCNNTNYGAGLEKASSLLVAADGTAPDGTTAYRYYTHAAPGVNVHGCILKEFDGADVGASFDLIRDCSAQAGLWATLSLYAKESDAEYFALTILDRTVQASQGTAAATHSVLFRWVGGNLTIDSSTGLSGPDDHWGFVAFDPLVGAGWQRIYLAWKIPTANDGDVLNFILRPSDPLNGDASLEKGTILWGAQFEWGDTGNQAGDVSNYQAVDGMHFWPSTRCIPGLVTARTLNLLGP